MLFTTIVTVVLSALPLLTTALPTPADASTTALAASAHNIYLVTCVPRKSSDDTNPTPAANFTAVAYFRKPINPNDTDSSTPQPNKAALVSQPPEPWEGVKWKLKVWKEKLFTASIAGGAESLATGELAGTAKLEDEDYACFRDGVTAIRIKEDELKGKCVADYWCAGLDAGKDTGDES
ncbi:hypothetical protein K458DRAFT_486033 [Lentithecium fluviatile CBS 122367]|uniref:Uncharacterized protein n=1 Tax=Lentithecium fluviatile CBS 122367 TaxID=1168545 RepID=A0A6G1J9L9_9PLEO|nr:hypothetical protein K458DRAFT_486033 [Lentithecium fluviatile CBS 122367]